MNEKEFEISIFNSKDISKIPVSPFNDDTFEFQTIKIKFSEIPFYLSSNYILNRNYKFNTIKRLRKRKDDLKKYLTKNIQYIVLDIDKVYSEESYERIIKILKKENYYLSLQKSRSFNNIDNFNLKGILLVTGSNDEHGIKDFLKSLQMKIGINGEVDLSVSREATHQAPTLSCDVVLQTFGKIPNINKIEKTKNKEFITNNEILYESIKFLNQLGFYVSKEKDDLISLGHPSEKTKNGYFIFKDNPFILHHFNPNKTKNLFKDLIKNKKIKKYFDELSKNDRLNLLKFKIPRRKNQIILEERYLKLNNNISNLIDDFLNSKKCTLKIQSPMGTGKSNIINEIINKTDKKILFITNRISIAKDIYNKYNNSKFNLKFYQEDDYKIGDNLICQYDSLWKYDLKNFDLIIIDEFVSLLFHSKNNLNDNVLNKIKFFYSLKKSHLVILDAFLYGIEDDFVKVTHSIINTYRDNINLIEYYDKNALLSKLVSLKTDKKITVSCNTRTDANTIKLLLEKHNKKCILLDSKVNEYERDLIHKTFKSNENNYNVLIFTPTLTVGVSIEFESDYHFHFDDGNTIDIISSLQMMKRNRNAKNIYFYIKERKRKIPYKLEYLKESFLLNIDKIDSSFTIDLDENGNYKLSKFGDFQLKIESHYNLLQINNKESFNELLKYQFKDINFDYTKKNEFLSIYKKEFKEKEKQEIEKIITKLDNLTNDNLVNFIEKNFKNLSKDEIKKLLYNYKNDFNFFEKIKWYHIYTKNKIDIVYNKIVNESISLKDKQDIAFLKILKSKNSEIGKKEKFTIKELKKIDLPIEKLKSSLRKLGYEWKYNAFILNKDIVYFSNKYIF